jgi:Chaperone of endosialidase
MGFLSSLGFGGGSTTTPASGFYSQPKSYQNLYNSNMNSAQSVFYNPDGALNSQMFTPSGQGYDQIMQGFTPTQQSLTADIGMQMNPYDKYVIDEMNTQAGGEYSLLKQALNQSGQMGSNRQVLGANDIDMRRIGQIGQFKQQGYNTALNNAMNVLPGLRSSDAYGRFNMEMNAKQAPYQTLQAAQGFLSGTPTSFGNFGNPQTKVSNPIDYGKIAMTGASLFSDERLKENIELVGEENGHNVYKFNYINEPGETFIGVMAQEVKEKQPDAVTEIDGYLAVNYNKIGVDFRKAS